MPHRKRRPDPVDIYVGSRIRLRRTLLGLSQSTLGEAIGVSFKQVQKYEGGLNRIGAGRLYEISVALGVPVSFFFEGAPSTGRKTATPALPADVLADRESARLVDIYYRIRDPKLRKQFLNLVRSIARG
jgi:transcriptional regulator with XRE-family HTH domain